MQKRKPIERRLVERRRKRRRLGSSATPVERRSGLDRRQQPRRGGVRRTADTFTFKKKLFAKKSGAR